MTMEKSTFTLNNYSYRCFTDQGLMYPAAGIAEYIIIETGSINAGVEKYLDLRTKNLMFILESLWVDLSAGSNNDGIDFTIWDDVKGQSFSTFSLSQVEVPYQFPPVVIFPNFSFKAKPASNIDRLILVGRHCQVDHHVYIP